MKVSAAGSDSSFGCNALTAAIYTARSLTSVVILYSFSLARGALQRRYAMRCNALSLRSRLPCSGLLFQTAGVQLPSSDGQVRCETANG